MSVRWMAPMTAALVLMLASAASPAQDWVNVMDHGAVGDGVADDTQAIRDAIAAASLTKQPVHFPRGDYRVTGPLTIERQLLTGLPAGGWPADVLPMPTLRVEHETGPAVTMKTGSSIHGLAFVYNRQKTPNPKASIWLDGNGLSITNVRLQYCHDGIITHAPTNVGRTNIENVFIVQPSGIGVYMTNTLDIPTLRNIEVWCNGPMQPGPAFKFGRNDELRASELFVLNTEVGILFEDDPLYAARGERAGTYGIFSNCSTDACSIGVRVTGFASVGFSGGDFWNHHDGFDINSDQAEVRIVGCDFSSNGAPAIHVRRAKAVIVNGCRVRRAFANPDVVSSRFAQVKALTVTNNQFAAFGPAMELSNGLGQALVAHNIFETSAFDKIRHRYTDKPELLVESNLGVPETKPTMVGR